jgi:HAD superfamily hydrolase (TIGR01549 family)
MRQFLPAYFAALEKRLGPFMNGQNLVQVMIASVQVVQANQDSRVSNMAAFMADLTQRIGFPLESIQPIIDTFYREDYPELRRYTTFRPEAQAVIRHLLAGGYKVVIATNPLFPATAVAQRLAWAGIRDFPYALVTTMENSHFSKPNLRYYQEILARVESTPETTWMVGDDPENDIAPARTLGLRTWWITNTAQHSPGAQPAPKCDKQGSLADFLTWIESGKLLS